MNALAYGALWLFVFAVPWERLAALPGLSIVTRVTGAVALGLTLLAMVVSGRFRRWSPFHVLAFLFVVWAGVGVLVLDIPVVPRKFYTFIQLFLVLWMIWELAFSEKRWRGLLTAYVLGVCVPAIATILLYIQEAGSSLRRFSAGGTDANNTAMTLALGLPIAWYLSLTAKGATARWIFRAYLPLCVLASTLTGSRGGLLTLMVALLVVPLTLSLSPGRLAAAVALLAVSGALAVTYVPEQVVERLGTTGSAVESADFGGRLKLWSAGVNAFVRKPLMGHGVSSFKTAVTPELGILALVAHNSFLSILVEEGLVGLALFLLMLLAVFLSILRLPHLERRFGLVLFATLGAAMTPLTWEDNKAAWLILALLIGMSVVKVTAARTVRHRRQTTVRRQPLPVESVDPATAPAFRINRTG